ncbi:hypothetical protein GYMLUDRAFT_783796 [Collybiopsis luxurians FD-317 M1]|uniref:BZIP domain-containing protein n=1 Tax=Collybiopsis luxurians FD-317 M1 TaxID=944289 RepID=A0A0D0BNL0_9AGAR|nr:hypothetical protein GYMLUDRAFT_783796 [Collybiopsis luxurians FD-317 M1]
MVRGRKRDVSAPLTRSLVLQRDYRARKAKYVVDLESRCQKLESENDLDRQETLASLTTEAELEKAHALNNVMFTLSSAAASIRSFQALTMGPGHTPPEDHQIERKHSLSGRRSSRPSPTSTPSNFSAYSDTVGLPNDNRPLQLYSPVSNTSRARSVSLSDSWNDLSPGLIDQGLPGDPDMDVSGPSHPRHSMRSSASSFPTSQGRPGPLLDFPNHGSLSLSTPLPRASSTSSFLEDGPSARGQMIPFSPNEFISQGIHPMATYERTLSQSLRNWT